MNFADQPTTLIQRLRHAPGAVVAVAVHALALLIVLAQPHILPQPLKMNVVQLMLPAPPAVTPPKPLPMVARNEFKTPPLPQIAPPQIPQDNTPPVQHNAPAIVTNAAAVASSSPAPQLAAVSPPPAAPAKPAAISPPRFDADYLDNPAPSYPPLSRRAREEGTVLLRVLVDASGGADKVELKESSGFERLDRAALNAVQRWRFVPARQGSEIVAAWVVVPIVFSLKQA